MDMDIYKEDEIQVLGMAQEQRIAFSGKGRILHIAVWLVSIGAAVFVLVLCWWTMGAVKDSIAEKQAVMRVQEDVGRDNTWMTSDGKITYCYHADDINDVSMHIYYLENMEAMLTMDVSQLADTTHTQQMLAVLATDIRKDNQLPVGDLVINGEKISRGKSREGYCAIVHGRISIGQSDNDDVMNYCIQEGGSFFREYPLVINGEICKNTIHGKRLRRALVQQDGDVYVIESENKESVHDFSEALRDLGIKDALYLPAGINYMLIKADSLHQENNLPEYGGNYLIFKSKK